MNLKFPQNEMLKREPKMEDEIMKMYPEDVIMYVLTRLQVKTLLRLKCVSKTWCALVKSSTFIHFYLNRTTTAKDEFILLKQSFQEEPDIYQSTLSFLFDQIDNGPVFSDVYVPYLTTSSGYTFHQLLGPCHGMILLTDSESIVLLINPATRKYRLLTPSTFICPLGFYHDIKGFVFGFDSMANSYKVISISEVVGDPPFYDLKVREWRVEVYDLITDSWRCLDYVYQDLPTLWWYHCSDIFYKGSLHWISASNHTFLILCFDLSTEIFRGMMMPDYCSFLDGKCYGLVVLNESLTLICYPNPVSEPQPGKELTDVWLMKEYGINRSWVKKYTMKTLPIEYPIVIWRDHVLFLQSKSGVLISYDLHYEEVKEYNFQGLPKSFIVAIYKESLIPVPKGSVFGNQVQTYNSDDITL